MKQPHKHADLIHAWADGAEIQYWEECAKVWLTIAGEPCWYDDHKYRIKPEPKPDVVRYISVDVNKVLASIDCLGNVKLTFDGETLELKAVEMIGENIGRA